MADFKLEIPNMDATLAKVKRQLDALQSGLATKAVVRAANRALLAIKAEAARQARGAYTAHPPKLFDRVGVQRLAPGRYHAELAFAGKPGHSLIHFKAKPNKPGGRRPAMGVSAQARRDQGRKVWHVPGYDRPFVMRKGVFVRKHGGRELRMLHGPSPVQALQRVDIQARLETRGGEMFATRLQHEIDAIIAGIA